MGDVTLSKAVRSNLLSLQSTAANMSKTQERLATGLKVNSALDNPTNFFTASSLNGRAGDLNRLLDAVSNATQTIEAADNGLSAITKLVESAQATARQAQQATGSKTTNKVVGDSGATFNPQSLSNVAGTGGSLTTNAAATVSTASIAADATIAAFSTGDLDGVGTGAGALSSHTAALASGDSLSLNVNGTNYTLTLDANTAAGARGGSAGAGYTATLGVSQTTANMVTQLNTLLTGSGVTVAQTNGDITFTSDATVESIRLSDGQSGATLTKLGLDNDGIASSSNSRVMTNNSTLDDLVAAGATMSVQVGSQTADTVTFGTAAGQVQNKADLISAINNMTRVNATGNAGGAGAISIVNADANDHDSAITLTSTAAGATALFTGTDVGSTTTQTTNAVNLLTSGDITAGETLSIKVGKSAELNVTFGNGNGEVSTIDELNAKLATLAGGAASVNGSDNLNITSDNAGATIKIGGSANALSSVGVTAGETANLIDGTNIANGDKLKITVGSNTQATITFGQGVGQVNTLEELETALGNVAGATATVDDQTGAITIEANNGSDSITVTSEDSVAASKNSVAAAFGLTNSATPIASTTTKSEARTTLENQYNQLLTQINELAEDSSFNGVNLLDGDDLNVIFNEDGSSKLDIEGVNFNSSGLGLSKLSADTFQTDQGITDTLSALDGAISSLRQQSSTFGSQLSVVETRQSFTKEMINTLETGAANLTLADSNEEAANLLALQTRQQLSSTALSLASQADQQVLRLF